MKSLVLSLLSAASLGVVLSLPFSLDVFKSEALVPRARSLGATQFAHYLHEANLTKNFTKKAGNFTLFVPINSAFKSLHKNITRNETLMRELLLFHSVNGTFNRKHLKDGKKLMTLSGHYLYFNVTKDKAVLVNGVNITKYNQKASNGMIFLIGEVILNGSGIFNKTEKPKPGKEALIPTARTLGATRFAHFVREANMTANFTKKAGNFTLFVPINSGWQDVHKKITGNKTLLAELIQVHAVPGIYNKTLLKHTKKIKTLSGKYLHINVTKEKAVLVNGVNITSYDNWASNGNIFLVGQVILNGSGVNNHSKSEAATQKPLVQRDVTTPKPHGHGSITHILAANYDHYGNLIDDLMKTGVWREIEGDNVTLLAPMNHAFHMLPYVFKSNLLNIDGLLQKTMKYHVIKGVHNPKSLTEENYLTTSEGHRVHAVTTNGQVTHFNKALVRGVIHASNGIIYIIDDVLRVPTHPIV